MNKIELGDKEYNLKDYKIYYCTEKDNNFSAYNYKRIPSQDDLKDLNRKISHEFKYHCNSLRIDNYEDFYKEHSPKVYLENVKENIGLGYQWKLFRSGFLIPTLKIFSDDESRNVSNSKEEILQYYQESKLHRIDGPATMKLQNTFFDNGAAAGTIIAFKFYLCGIDYEEEQYNETLRWALQKGYNLDIMFTKEQLTLRKLELGF